MKKLLSLFLVLSLVFGLTACTKPADQNPTVETTPTNPTITPKSDPTTPTADPSAIYRDVKIQSFTYSETLEAQEGKTDTARISGHEIDQDTFTSGDYTNGNADYRVKGWVKLADGDINNCLVEKYKGDTQVWSATVKSFNPDGFCVLSDGVMVYGNDSIFRESYMMKFSEKGEFLWKHKLENREIVSIKSVVENADGTYAAFSSGWIEDKQCIYLNHVSADGKAISYKTNTIGENKITCIARVGDSYWLRIGRDEFSVVRMDLQGNVLDSLSFGEENANYNIKGITEFNGKVYMSVISSPKIAEKNPDSHNGQELYDILALCKDIDEEAKKEWEAAGGGHNLELENKKYDITDRIKKHYTAMLLVLDAETGKPLAFYSAKEAFGGKLVVNEDGTLLWCVKDIVAAYRTPLSCSSYWDTNCQVYEWVLDNTGKLISVKKTDDTADWYFD